MLAIYIQGKSSHVTTKLLYLEFFINEIFSVEKFPNYGIYVHTYIHAYTYIHMYIHTYIPTCMYAYIHRHIHTYIHAYIHTYIHIHTYICTYIQYSSISTLHTHVENTRVCTRLWRAILLITASTLILHTLVACARVPQCTTTHSSTHCTSKHFMSTRFAYTLHVPHCTRT